jgi:hypothetical protein
MKKKIGTIICFMLLLSMTSIVVTGQKIDIKNDKNIIIYQNNPPTEPIITAPDKTKIYSDIVIKVVSTDPDEDKIYYRFRLTEKGPPSNWVGPYDSGIDEEWRFRTFHIGDLTIGAQAKDENGATSDWSYHTVSYTRAHSRNIFGNTLLNFLQRLFNIIS